MTISLFLFGCYYHRHHLIVGKRTAQDKKLSKEVEQAIRIKKEQQNGDMLSTSIPTSHSPSSAKAATTVTTQQQQLLTTTTPFDPQSSSMNTRTRAVSAPHFYHHYQSKAQQQQNHYHHFDEFDPEDPNSQEEGSMDDQENESCIDENGIPIIKSNDYMRNIATSSFLSPALSPPCPHDLSVPMNPFGDTKSDTQKFIDLISLLNLSYPDYDFSGIKQEDFSREMYKERLINSINLSLRDALNGDQLNQLWRAIDSIVSIYECEIYTYNPDRNQDDPTGDPLALSNGKIWVWNYFFYSKKLRRCLFFACSARNKAYYNEDSDDMSDSDYDTTYSNSKNANVHMAPRNYYDSDEDMYFDDL